MVGVPIILKISPIAGGLPQEISLKIGYLMEGYWIFCRPRYQRLRINEDMNSRGQVKLACPLFPPENKYLHCILFLQITGEQLDKLDMNARRGRIHPPRIRIYHNNIGCIRIKRAGVNLIVEDAPFGRVPLISLLPAGRDSPTPPEKNIQNLINPVYFWKNSWLSME